jgi:putative nucleotidyltransferase with HDIG domain
MAEAMARRIDCDIDLLRAGAFLHDIGRSVDHSIMHAVIGASIAADLGLTREVVEIIRKHVGAGLDD